MIVSVWLTNRLAWLGFVGLMNLIPVSFDLASIQGREFTDVMFNKKEGFPFDIFAKQITLTLGMMLDTTTMYILIPVCALKFI